MYKTCVMTFGRFNPPTIGHAELVNCLIQTAKRVQGDACIYTSQTQDALKNPLPLLIKNRFLRRLFPTVFVRDLPQVRTMIDAFLDIAARGYTHVIVVAGSDRIANFEKLRPYFVSPESSKYDRTKHIPISHFQVISSGTRDPDDGISATKLRGYAKTNDFEHFAEGVPSQDVYLVMDLFTQVRQYMGIHETFKLPPLQRLLESYRVELQKEESVGYQKHLKAMLKEHGYNSAADIPDDTRDNFFEAVDREWKTKVAESDAEDEEDVVTSHAMVVPEANASTSSGETEQPQSHRANAGASTELERLRIRQKQEKITMQQRQSNELLAAKLRDVQQKAARQLDKANPRRSVTMRVRRNVR